MRLGHPVVGSRGTSAADVHIDFAPGTTLAQAQAAQLYATTVFDWGAPAHASWSAAQKKDRAKADYDRPDERGRLLRAVVALLVQEFNEVRQWCMAHKAANAAAVNFADLKARVALLPNLPDRTVSQARNALRNLIDGEP